MPQSLLFRCRSLYDELDRYLDGEMGIGDRFSVKIHLIICPKCRIYLRQYAAIRELSQNAQKEELPADFEQVMSSVLARWRQERDS